MFAIRFRFGVLAACTVAALTALAAAPFASAAKPTPKPAPTCPSGQLIAPTFAFMWDFQLYVGNADGTCAVALTPVAQQYLPAFAFDGTRYRVFWVADTRDEVKLISRMRWTIKTVEFKLLANGNIDPSSLTVRELWRDSVTTSESSVGSPAVNTNASQLVFTRKYAGVTELKRLNLTSCTPTCAPPTTWLTISATGFKPIFGRANDDRLYFNQLTASGVFELGYFATVSAQTTLSGPTVILDSTEIRYSGTRLSFGSVGRFDFDGDGSLEDLVSYVWGPDGGEKYVDVVQLGTGCVAGQPLCVDRGDASIVASSIFAGDGVSLEWTPSGNLLRQVAWPDGTQHIQTISPRTGDVMVEHGIGFNQAALKQ